MEIMGEDGVLRDHVICQRGQYGMPSASFYWTRELNAWMLQTFNSSTFRIVQIVRFRAMEGPNACTHVRVAVYANKP